MGTKTVLTLIYLLLNEGYKMSMDKFFSSPHLFDFLCSKNTNALGKLRANKKEAPKDLFGKKLKKGKFLLCFVIN